MSNVEEFGIYVRGRDTTIQYHAPLVQGAIKTAQDYASTLLKSLLILHGGALTTVFPKVGELLGVQNIANHHGSIRTATTSFFVGLVLTIATLFIAYLNHLILVAYEGRVMAEQLSVQDNQWRARIGQPPALATSKPSAAMFVWVRVSIFSAMGLGFGSLACFIIGGLALRHILISP